MVQTTTDPRVKEYSKIMRRYATTLGRTPDGYRELATAWALFHKNNGRAYAAVVQEVKGRRAIIESTGRKYADGDTGARRLSMTMPAGLNRFLLYSDPEVFSNKRKYAQLRRALPELCYNA